MSGGPWSNRGEVVRDALAGILAMFAATVGFFLVTGLTLSELHGLWGRKDIISAYGQAKWLNDSPLTNTYEFLGYPRGQDWSHFPVIDLVTRLEITALTSFLEPVLAVNVLYLVSFPAVAGLMYVSLRLLLVSRYVAVIGSVAFALLGAHFDHENPYLANYWLVPVSVLWLASLVNAKSVMQRTSKTRVMLSVGVASAVCVGVQNPQLAAFVIILGAIGLAFQVRTALPGLSLRLRLLIFAVAPLAFAATLVGGRLSRSIPAIFNSSERSVEESYTWGGKLLSLFEVSGDSWLSGNPVNRSLTDAVTTSTWTGAPAQQSAIIVAATLFMLACGFYAIMAPPRGSGRRQSLLDPIRPWLGMWLAGLLFFVTTGLGVAFAAFVNPQVRGWYRLAVPLAALAVTAACVFLTRLRQRLLRSSPDRWRRPLWIGLCTVLAVLLLDSFTQIRPIHADTRLRQSLTDLVSAGEAALGSDCAILNIPLVDFPEAYPRGRMEAYDHLLPFLETSSWRFSYGAIKGQLGSRWSDHLAGEPRRQAAQAKSLGFCGILVDRNGLESGAPPVEQYVEEVGPPIASADDRWYLFSLQDTDPDPLAQDFLSRPETRYGPTFTAPQADEDAVVTRWTTSEEASITVWNPSTAPQTVVMELPVAAANCGVGQVVDVRVDGVTRTTLDVAPGGLSTVRVPLLLPARDRSVVELRTPSLGCVEEGHDVAVGIRIEDASYTRTGPQAVAPYWGQGFLAVEYDLSGIPKSWTTGGGSASIDLLNTTSDPIDATIDLELLAPPCGQPREISIGTDGQTLAVTSVAPGETVPLRLPVSLQPFESVSLSIEDLQAGCSPPGDSRLLGIGVRDLTTE